MTKPINFIVLSLILLCLAHHSIAQQFTQITEGEIVNEPTISAGSSWIDYNNDNYLDLFVVNTENQSNFLYRNNGDGTFTKIIEGVIVEDVEESTGHSWGDFNNDHHIDLFVANGANNENLTNSLYLNNGDGTFTKITEGCITEDRNDSNGCSWADYDNDGLLDLYVVNWDDQNNLLYHNEGENTFSKITSGDIVNDGGSSFGCSWADYDNDNDLDPYVVNGGFIGRINFFYRNDRMIFTKVRYNIIVVEEATSRGCSWADYDNDGDLDLFVANGPWSGSETNSLYANDGRGNFDQIDEGDIVTIEDCSMGSSWGDYDNDGDLDLFVSRVRDNNILYENNGDGTFTTITEGVLVEETGGYGTCWGDYDNDGDLDLFVAISYNRPNLLYRNDGNDNHWINIKCVGTVSNTSAIGAKVRAFSVINDAPVWQLREISSQTGGGYGGQNMLNVHFGFGQTIVIDTLRLEWPSDTVQVFTNIAVDQFLTIHETGMAAVTGMVTDGQNPLPGVRMTAVDSSRAHAAISNESGYYHLPLLPGSYTLTATLFGYEDGIPAIIDTIGANEEQTFDFSLPPFPRGTLRGVISEAYDLEASPIPNAEIKILDTPIASTFSDELGRYLFADVPEGEYTIHVNHVNCLPDEADVTIWGEETTIQHFELVVPLSFEETDGDFNGEGGWEWGIPQPEGGPEGVYDGEKCWGTLLTEPYGPHLHIDLITPEFDLVEDQPAYELHFHHWYETNTGWDGGNVQISTDGGENWSLIHPEGGYPSMGVAGLSGQPGYTGQYEEWHPAVFDLSEYVGQTVQFRFHFGSTNSPPRFDGWFIDYFYVLGQQVYQVGVEPADDTIATPRMYELLPNYPNPFNPTTTIAYALPQRSSVTLQIYDISGKLVQTLLDNESQPAGQHTIEWNAGNLSSGVYFYQLSIPDSSPLVRKAVVLK